MILDRQSPHTASKAQYRLIGVLLLAGLILGTAGMPRITAAKDANTIRPGATQTTLTSVITDALFLRNKLPRSSRSPTSPTPTPTPVKREDAPAAQSITRRLTWVAQQIVLTTPATDQQATDRASTGVPIPTTTASPIPTPTPDDRLFSTMLPPPADPDDWNPTTPYRFVEETGHNLGLTFQSFYAANGGVVTLGHPITEVLRDTESGHYVQYFERARMELAHDQDDAEGSPQVALTRVGALLTEQHTGLAFMPRQNVPEDHDPAFFAETGYRISGKFYDFWEEHGGVRTFGYPISGELLVKSAGKQRLAQYFERARLEYFPEHADTPNAVQVGRLGIELARQQKLPWQLMSPAEPIVKLSSATTTFGDSAGTYNAALAASRLHGQVIAPGATFSFLETLGDISSESGYTNGAAIVNGRIVPIVAGGICQTSTTFYRAAFNAGLEITERHPHSLYIAAFNDVVSFDAAVFSPGLDLRTVNDTPYPILIVATSIGGSITVDLWGQDDGRTTEMIAPAVQAEYAPPATSWRYDPNLPPDATEQVVSPRNGMEVVLGRVVKTADGKIIHRDSFFTEYSPVAGEIRYGAAVTPPKGAVIVGDLPPEPTPTAEPTSELPTATPVPELPTPTAGDEPAAEEAVPTAAPGIPDKTDWTGGGAP